MSLTDKIQKPASFNPHSVVCREFDINETIKCLKHPNIWVFFSWGSKNFINWKNQMLSFKVNGMKFKGTVNSVLNGSDLYDIYYVNRLDNLKHESKDVYFDQLQEVIDSVIEK